MDKEAEVHIYGGILLSHEKEHIWVRSSEGDEPRAYHTEWRKSESERQYRILTHACGIQKNGTDESICRVGTENSLVEPRGEGEGRMNWEGSLDIHTPPCAKQVVVGSCCSTGHAAWTELCDDPEGWGGVSGKGAQKGGVMCVCIADSPHCTAEANKTL